MMVDAHALSIPHEDNDTGRFEYILEQDSSRLCEICGVYDMWLMDPRDT